MIYLSIMSLLDRDLVHDALSLLGEVLRARGEPPLHLVVSGGAALLAAGLVTRVTNDVDVIARRGEVDGEVFAAHPLPAQVKEAVADVARELDLRPNWLNAATGALMIDLARFPPDFLADTVEKEYGPNFKITYIGRPGQLYLKFYAAVARDEPRDLADLRAMRVTPAEALRIGIWMLADEVISVGNKPRLCRIATELNCHEIVSDIERFLP